MSSDAARFPDQPPREANEPGEGERGPTEDPLEPALAAGPLDPAELEASAVTGTLPARPPWYEAIWPWGLSGVREAIDVFVLALIMLIAVRFVAYNYIVDGPSMQPTFHDGEFVVVNRLAYRSFDLSWLPGQGEDGWRPFGEPRPGDVIVFRQVSSGIAKDLIKRVIAVEGQTVEVRGGTVYVDGEALDEPYISAPPDYEVPPTTVPPGELFVLGDNRINSADSHLFGPIEESQVVGRADLRYWPVDAIGRIEHVLGVGEDTAPAVQP